MKSLRLLAGLLLGMSTIIAGCNLYGKIDSPKSLEERLDEAQILMDKGQCQLAVDKLREFSITGTDAKNDKYWELYGWAQLCAAGAPFDKVAGTLLTFSASSSNSLQVVGNLVNSIGPASTDSINGANNAKNAFLQISDLARKRRLIYAALADVVEAAMYVSKNATTGTQTVRTDIAGSSCFGQTCTSAPAQCAANSSHGKMTNGDATAFYTLVQEASSYLGQDSGFGNAAELITTLLNALGGGAQNAIRCSIVNNMLSS